MAALDERRINRFDRRSSAFAEATARQVDRRYSFTLLAPRGIGLRKIETETQGALRVCSSSDRDRGGVHHHRGHDGGGAPWHVRDATRPGAHNAHAPSDDDRPNARLSTPIRSRRPNSSDHRYNKSDRSDPN
jgi:hypothetical protein